MELPRKIPQMAYSRQIPLTWRRVSPLPTFILVVRISRWRVSAFHGHWWHNTSDKWSEQGQSCSTSLLFHLPVLFLAQTAGRETKDRLWVGRNDESFIERMWSCSLLWSCLCNSRQWRLLQHHAAPGVSLCYTSTVAVVLVTLRRPETVQRSVHDLSSLLHSP